jgi:hypothetical protein
MVLITALIPLLNSSSFYVQDDTINFMTGMWYHTGQEILQGRIPVFNVNDFASGNYLVEGQWGTYSPLMWLFGVFVYLCDSFVFSLTVIKIITLLCLSIGVYLLAKSFEISELWSSLAGFFSVNIGYVKFIGAASWITDLISLTLFVYTFWAYRSFVRKHSNIWLPFFFGFLLISQGYLYGILYLVVVLASHFVILLYKRNWTVLRKVFLLDLLLMLISLSVLLPGLITGSFTVRTQGILNGDFGSPTITDLVNNFFPFSQTSINIFGFAKVYTDYVFWLPILLVFVNYRGFKKRLILFLRNEVDLGIVSIVVISFSFFMLLSPDQMGPIRFPFRNIQYLGLLEIIVCTFVISKSTGFIANKKRFIAFFAFVVFGAFLNWSQVPWLYKEYILGIILFMVLGVVLFACRRKLSSNLLYLPIVLLSVIISFFQSVVGYNFVNSPNDTSVSNPVSWSSLSSKKELEKYTPPTKGSVAVFGNFGNGISTPENYLFSNYWYVPNISTINGYSPTSYASFANFFGIETHGIASSNSSGRMFSINKRFSKSYADLLAIDNVLIFKNADIDENFYEQIVNSPPVGWYVKNQTSERVLLSRQSPIEQVGGITAESPDAKITQIKNTNRSVTFRVVSSQASDVKVAFSRIAWPGYTISDGKLNNPVNGFLVNATISKKDFGKIITLTFNPPFYNAGRLFILLSILVALVTGIFEVRQRKRAKNAKNL